MTARWMDVRLGDVATVTHGFAFSGEYFVDTPSGEVLVTPGNFAIGGGFKLDKPKYYRGPVPSEFVLAPGDLVITMTDLSKTSDTLGYGALVPRTPGLRLLHNQRIGRVFLKSPEKVSLRFLHWILRTPRYRDEILASASGSTVKHTAPSRVEAYCFPLPSLSEQCAIAGLLDALDEKIQLNRRTNETLEAMARALFKSWFVDFDPVRAKMAGREPEGVAAVVAALLPDGFDGSELGPIPRGWRVGPVTSVQADTKYACVAGPFGSNLTSRDYIHAGVPVIRGVNLSTGGVFLRDDDFVYVSNAKADSLEGNLAFPGDVIFTQRGTLGQVAIIPSDTPYLRFVISQSQMKLSVDLRRGSSYYVTLYFQQQRVVDQILANGQQAGVPHVNLGFLRKFSVLLPPTEVLRAFDHTVVPWLSRAHARARESKVLIALRDALLPKLLSGELGIPDAERIVGKAV